MKKLAFVLIITLSFLSCSIDDNGANNVGDFYSEYIPFESVSMPQEFMFGESYVIEYTYFRPSTCHTFSDLFSDVNNNTWTIAISNIVSVNNGQCMNLQDELVTRTFTFIVNGTGPYLFRFWQGKDSNGEDIYLELERTVVQ